MKAEDIEQEIRKICSKYGLEVPTEDNIEEPSIEELFESFLNLASEPFFEFKLSSNI